MSFERRDVVLTLFPNSDLVTAKRRAALVVQADGLDTGIEQTVLALITSNQARAGHASRVTVLLTSDEAKGTGLRTDSVIMSDDLATVSNSVIVRSIGSFSRMDLIDAALRHTLGLSDG